MKTMNNLKSISLLLLTLICSMNAFAQTTRSNCPVKEEIFTKLNPDGSHITLSVTGNEMLHYFETIDGYTVLEREDGFYEFAALNEQLNLIGSGQIARNESPILLKNQSQHLRYSNTQIELLSNAFYQFNPVNLKKANKPFPAKGKRRVLAILVQYPDLAATLPKSNFDSMMMKPNFNGTGSFRDYYLKTSFGNLDLQVDVVGWYTSTLGYINYAKSDANYMSNVGELVYGAVMSADASVDFSKYDNDSDGVVDGIIVLHAGIGAEEQSAPSANNYIWSHRYNLAYTSGTAYVDGVSVDAYGIFPEKRYNSGAPSMVGIGVISHEFGHLLDLPDLYSTQSKGEGAGNFANMAGGPWLNSERTPCLHEAWSRNMLGWMPTTLIASSGTYTIPKGVADSNFAFRINTTQNNEYFLLENRQKKGFDLYLPGRGLAIWHINASKARLLSVSGGNNVNNDTSAYGVGLLQADGKRDLEIGSNRGDAGDLYPGSSNNRSLNNYSKPNSALHLKVGGIKQASNIVISNITQNADSSISFTIGNKPSAGFDASSTNGCAPLYVDFTNISAFASSYLWKFHDGSTSTIKNQNYTYTTPGNYLVTLFVLDSANQIVDSSQQTIIVNSSPKAAFTMDRTDSNTFILKDLSTNKLYINWRFGSNQSSTSAEVNYKIIGQASVPFKLIAYSQNLCSDTALGIMDYWPLSLGEKITGQNFNVFPNPFQNKLSIKIGKTGEQELAVKVIDLIGNIVFEQKNLQIKTGQTDAEISLSGIKPGVYFIEIKGQKAQETFKIIAQ